MLDILPLPPANAERGGTARECAQGSTAEAILSASDQMTNMSHAQLRHIIAQGLGLRAFGLGKHDAVMILLPNGKCQAKGAAPHQRASDFL